MIILVLPIIILISIILFAKLGYSYNQSRLEFGIYGLLICLFCIIIAEFSSSGLQYFLLKIGILKKRLHIADHNLLILILSTLFSKLWYNRLKKNLENKNDKRNISNPDILDDEMFD